MPLWASVPGISKSVEKVPPRPTPSTPTAISRAAQRATIFHPAAAIARPRRYRDEDKRPPERWSGGAGTPTSDSRRPRIRYTIVSVVYHRTVVLSSTSPAKSDVSHRAPRSYVLPLRPAPRVPRHSAQGEHPRPAGASLARRVRRRGDRRR